ncbi:MAG TPA: twin transmembrane helix small protein [Steroidobacteraceae bacterium]|jgi:type IV secretory pathway TrbL component|nr:twin transmembrane helix small protein [Steroidobacteraceae bacterium]
MRLFLWLLILLTLAAIIASLGSGLFHLSRGREEDSRKLARALTVRIALSLVLFALLMIAWYLGLISPHPLQGGGAVAPHG